MSGVPTEFGGLEAGREAEQPPADSQLRVEVTSLQQDLHGRDGLDHGNWVPSSAASKPEDKTWKSEQVANANAVIMGELEPGRGRLIGPSSGAFWSICSIAAPAAIQLLACCSIRSQSEQKDVLTTQSGGS